MNLKNIDIRAKPRDDYLGQHVDSMEFDIEIVVGNKLFTTREIIPLNEFESHFDIIMKHMVQKLKAMLIEKLK